MKVLLYLGLVVFVLCTSGCPEEQTAPPSSSSAQSTTSSEEDASGNERIPVSSFSVVDLTDANEPVAQWSRSGEQALEKAWFEGHSSGFERVSASDTAARIQVSILYSVDEEEDSESGTTPAMANVGFEVEATDPVKEDVPRRFLTTLLVSAPMEESPGSEEVVFNRLLKTGVSQVRLEIQVRMAVWRGSDQDILTGLSSRNPARVEESIRAVGERDISRGVQPLIALLKEDGEHVFEAVGALASLGDSAALKPLSRLTSSPDPQLLQVVVYAMADIGGAESKKYLRAIATGHPWPTIRKLAQERLDQNKTP